MVWPAIIAAAATVYGAYAANKASAKQSAQQMDFQERMSRTAHQREVDDLRAAGLNPILSGTGGRGASTPPGAQAPQKSITADAVSSAVAGMRAKQEVKLLKEQTATTKAAGMAHDMQRLKTSREYNILLYGEDIAEMDRDVRRKNQRGDLDAAEFWSGTAYGIKRRADAALETARKLIPFTTPGQVSPRKYKGR